MKEITEKLHKQAIKEFSPILEEMAKNGADKNEIVAAFQAQLKLKTQQYYDKAHNLTSVKDIFKNISGEITKQNADSKAEQIFYDLLIQRGLKFEFQYKIGIYRADYLFAGILVVELDGPQHEKNYDERRDQYMRRMGYVIIRIPLWVLVSCPEAVVEQITETVGKLESIPAVN